MKYLAQRTIGPLHYVYTLKYGFRYITWVSLWKIKLGWEKKNEIYHWYYVRAWKLSVRLSIKPFCTGRRPLCEVTIDWHTERNTSHE